MSALSIDTKETISVLHRQLEAMLDRCISGRPKGAKDVKPRKRFNKKTKKVMIMGIEYVDAKSASKILKMPYSTITSRCNGEKYTDWLYL